MEVPSQQKPNIVFILSDDQGAWALGCAGNHEIRTPNLDQLASEGVRFSNFFCTSPVCSPARASLLTGKIPSQHGIHDWISEGNIGEKRIEYLSGQTAYTEILAENGYICGISGKWHLGDSLTPQKGFSHWFVHQSGGGVYYDAPMIRNGELVNESGYLTDVITDDALSFLEKQDCKQPFYLSVHYTAPHDPWINSHPQEIVDSYDDCLFETCPQEQTHPNLIRTAPEGSRENLKGYFASITAMDQNIGRIMDKLEQMGIREQTLICFLSDNGFNCGHHGIWGKGNGTFPQNMYDTSVKVPAIFSHLGRISEGKVCDELVSGYDFIPTLLEYVGVNNLEGEKLPGTSFLPFLIDQQTSGQSHIVVFDEYGPVRMVRTKEWKYIHRYPYGPHELYDVVNDPEEKVNRINDLHVNQQRIDMKAILEEWFYRYVEPAKDATHEAVTGLGQIDLAGVAGKGKQAFNDFEKTN
ncbi:sulfatase-like hydrolase/transferase [Sporosarcina sp. YIM B06819]|uniref:sulfatase-like hydrolase/transferase n=1 Tax=Sporosarcina sp. YIM B06819 TaxID=3081769 RepID=UPI00298C115D|nr:sulfatase-like hydrolase/transferase [Sporosarcina sp. YIM B06819]